ncbi:MAG: hypothetical protein ACXV3F_09985 [Frankiaceae bacterium]
MYQHKQHLPLYVLAGAILLVGLLAAGVPPRALFFLVGMAGCGLMHVFMMKGMHGRASEPHREPHPGERSAGIRLGRDLR